MKFFALVILAILPCIPFSPAERMEYNVSVVRLKERFVIHLKTDNFLYMAPLGIGIAF